MQIGDTIVLEALSAPEGVTLLDEPETVLATLSPPRLQTEAEEEIETETELVGEGEAAERRRAARAPTASPAGSSSPCGGRFVAAAEVAATPTQPGHAATG